MTRRAILYLRLSQADDASTSIGRQEADLRELADREGWEVAQVLADDGISGRKTRAKADAALQAIRDGEADVLAVWKLDRWTRQGLAAVGDLVEALDARPDALFVALRDGLRSDQAAWRIIAVVLAEVARTEAENTATRVRSSIKTLRHSGRWPGGAIPFGYRSAPAPDGPGRILEPSPTEAPIVREIAESLLAGASLTAVVRDLTARRIPTARSPYRLALANGRTPAEDADRGTWRIQTIKVLMHSDHLLGRQVHHGQLVTGEDGLPVRPWEPILDLATLTRLRAILSSPKGSGRPRVRQARLLSGLVYCGYCGRKCYVRTSNGRPIYGCSAGPSGGHCPMPRITAEGLEDFVVGEFLAVAGSAQEVEEIQVVTDPGTTEALAEVEAALLETSGALTDDSADVAALLGRLESLKTRRAELRAVSSSVETHSILTGRTLAEAWAEALDDSTRRSLLLEALDHVRITSRQRRGPQFERERVELLWRS